MPSKLIIKPKRDVSVVSELLKVYNDQSATVHARKGDPSRLLNLRPSQLPFCAVATFIQRATMGLVDVMDMRGSFYVSIGTAVHEVVQNYLGTSGRFLANWECKICGKKTYVTKQFECCDFPMQYHEIEIHYKGVVGHIDAVFIDSRGRYWILDFKTTSVKAAPSKQKSPGVVYIEQVETYALMMKLQHKIKIEGVLLMFIKRDAPTDPVIWHKTINERQLLQIKNRTIEYKRWHKRVLKAETKKQVLELLDQGSCSNPYCTVCKRRDVKKVLLDAYAKGKRLNRLPIISLTSK